MKRILITLMMIAAFCSLSLAQKKSTIYKDSAENVKITISKTETEDDSVYTPEYTDTTEDGITVESESTDSYDDSYDDSSIISKEDFSLLKDLGSAASAGIALAFFVLLLTFGFPIFVIFIAFYFRYKSRRERYKLVEKAIAAGQPIPEGILKESSEYGYHRQRNQKHVSRCRAVHFPMGHYRQFCHGVYRTTHPVYRSWPMACRP